VAWSGRTRAFNESILLFLPTFPLVLGCKLVLEDISGEGLNPVEAEIKALFKER
jgi:hypothetical protein